MRNWVTEWAGIKDLLNFHLKSFWFQTSLFETLQNTPPFIDGQLNTNFYEEIRPWFSMIEWYWIIKRKWWKYHYYNKQTLQTFPTLWFDRIMKFDDSSVHVFNFWGKSYLFWIVEKPVAHIQLYDIDSWEIIDKIDWNYILWDMYLNIYPGQKKLLLEVQEDNSSKKTKTLIYNDDWTLDFELDFHYQSVHIERYFKRWEKEYLLIRWTRRSTWRHEETILDLKKSKYISAWEKEYKGLRKLFFIYGINLEN